MRIVGRWFSAVATVTMAATATARSLTAQTELGLKAGLTFGNISNKGVLPGELSTRSGIAAGLSLGARSGVVGVGLDVLYAQRGLKSSTSLADARTRLDYLDLPVYLRAVLPSPGIRPFVYAGPQFSWELRCRRANGTSCNPAPNNRPSLSYAGVIGAGVRLGGAAGLSLEGRYIYGLTDLKVTTLTSTRSFKHRTFLLLLSVGN